MRVVIRHAVSGSKQHNSVIRRVIYQAVKKIGFPRGVILSVSFIGDKKMYALNQQYRQQNKTTNVLAFKTTPEYPKIPESLRIVRKIRVDPGIRGQRDLGDIFISYAEARREAKQYGWTMRYEIARLTLHGFLHLLGYNHVKRGDAKAMEGLEKLILKNYVEH